MWLAFSAIVLVLVSLAHTSVIFVCVTGQLSRLEVDSKVENFVRFHANKSAIVDVALVLAPGARFTNKFRYNVSYVQTFSLQTVAARFLEAGATTVSLDGREQSNDVIVSDAYLATLDKKHMSPANRRLRVAHHVRQWEAMQRCWPLRMRANYTHYVRLRDDSAFHEPQSLKHFVADGVHVPACNSWSGFNDRGAIIIGERYAKLYFTGMLEFYDNVNAAPTFYSQHRISNPERFLAAALKNATVPVTIACRHEIKFTSSHRNANGTCLSEVDEGYAGARTSCRFNSFRSSRCVSPKIERRFPPCTSLPAV